MAEPYLVSCFNCFSEFDAVEAIWCSCNPQSPTKVCPFCMGCFCAAGEDFRIAFWASAPSALHDEVATLSQARMLIGEMLVRAGLITTTQLLDALNCQRTDGRRIGEILIDRGVIGADRLERFLRSQHTVMTIDLSRARVDAALLQKLGVERCLAERFLPIEAEAFQDRVIVTLAMADPSDTATMERVRAETGAQIIAGAAPAQRIEEIIRAIFPQAASGTAAPTRHAAQSDRPTAAAAARRAIDLAIDRRASHLHFQDQGGGLRLAYRIDGGLFVDRGWPDREAAAARRGFEEMAGSASSSPDGPESVLVTVEAEGRDHALIVRRGGAAGHDLLQVKIVDPPGCPSRLEDCGLPRAIVDRLDRALEASQGLVIVAAPPFSGASTVMRALVMHNLAQGRPVSVVSSVASIILPDGHVQEEFVPSAEGSLRDAIARADARGAGPLFITSPEGAAWPACDPGLPSRRLLVCRLTAARPHEALMAVVAAGCDPDALASAPTLLYHQVLARRLCPSCRTGSRLTAEEAALLRLPAEETGAMTVWREGGCADCALGRGLRGCVPLSRAMALDEAVARALRARDAGEVLAACRGAGLESLRAVALAAMREGAVSPAEIIGRRSAVAATALDRA